MFGSQTLFSVLFVVFAACAFNALADQHVFTGTFNETRERLPNAYVTGSFKYLYDTENASNSRFRLDYVLGGDVHVTFLYKYMYDPEQTWTVVYSICSGGNCKAQTTSEKPDPWWFNASIYEATGVVEEEYTWYRRSEVTNSSQITEILMNGNENPAGTSVRAIKFKDGRNLRIDNFEHSTDIDAFDEVFEVPEGCPEPRCRIFADIVFVVDNSNSVVENEYFHEWNDTLNFIEGVMDSFDFGGDKGAAAAVIQFNGLNIEGSYSDTVYNKPVECVKDGVSNGNELRPWKDYRYYEKNYPLSCSATGFAGKVVGKTRVRNAYNPKSWCIRTDPETHECAEYEYSGMPFPYYWGYETSNFYYYDYTVSTDLDDLKTALRGDRPDKIGDTCQAFGLELAMKAFDDSDRKDDPDLKRVVIAITDGADHCPNRTVRAAERLRDVYHALFIGVGVGLECEYDEKFIRNLTSSLGSDSDEDKLYVSVNDYRDIRNYVIEVFGRLCDKYSTSCPEGCDAFCACEACFCPQCNGNGDKCTDPTCEVEPNTQSSLGCVVPKSFCDEVEDSCHENRCNPTTGEWNCKASVCDRKMEEYPYVCQEKTCLDGDDECTVSPNDDMCNYVLHQNNCQEWRCLSEPVGPTNPKVDDYGCYVVNDITDSCLGSESECFQPSCQKSETTGEVTCDPGDNCTENECYTHMCVDLGNGHSYCKATEKPTPEKYVSTNCLIYECINETGWRMAKVWNNNTCREAAEAAGKNTSCRTFYCNDDDTGGCKEESHEEECNAACDAILSECWNNAAEMSLEDPIGNCTLGKCGEPDINGEISCDYTSFNCSKDMKVVNECESKNRQYANTRCFTIMCEYGRCVCDEILPAPRSNKCVNWTCEGDRYKGWNWTSHPTEDAIACNVSRDACYTRECKPDTGCEVTEICAAQGKNDMCNRYVCEDNNQTCKPKPLLMNYTCMHEICVNGVIIPDWGYLEACPNGHNCTNIECVKDKTSAMYGRCLYTSKLAEKDKEPCYEYVCNKLTDEWEGSFSCDDHNYCTNDYCAAGDKCRNIPITCYDELDMENYPCFKADCREDYNNKSYRCVRKLRAGSYIDICGQCIRADDDEDSNAQTAIACTDAPDEPVLKEGLAAASIALIILGAIIIGAALATSGVLGTKSLLERARAANNQSVVSNPLFEDSATEMTNPAFAGDN